MTGEAQKVTDQWVSRHGAEYAYAFDTKGELGRWAKVGGIPHAILVDPNGTIVWRGNPAGLKPKVVEKALKGAIKRPISDWPKSAAKVKKALGKRDFAKAFAAAEKIEGDERGMIVSELEAFVNAKRDCVKDWMTEGNYLAVDERGSEFADQLDGLLQGEEIEQVLKQLKDDDAAQDVLDAQHRVQKLLAKKRKKGSIAKIKRELKQIAAGHRGTYAERDANNALVILR